ncbi:epoxide hydrolase family protein [Agrococcus sp. ARC_14]|uniref:epoxide hydrolase family protein n=1 Tax=Agrococcus sp. ARC_14 TaxID=2919927 RepID=UPI001F05D8BE|nr:epoxide hydrolase family protein [Agrococcus sp. ARC_14]MCH1882073.1 epoxide hydrolase [Agrococcus sp. ARC_14]
MSEPFEFRVSDEQLERLRARLADVVLPEPTPGARGIPMPTMQRLVDRWRDGFDWRAVEARLASYEHRVATIEGTRIHFVHVRGGRPGAVPIVLTHGWPYTFAEMLPLAEALRGEVDVVIPSLPGFGWSEPLPEPFTSKAVARRWRSLMVDELGYERFLTYGEDVGTGVSDWLAGAHADAVAGLVATHASFGVRDRGEQLDAAEAAFFDRFDAEGPLAGGYAHQQGSRPDTTATALLDSPVGLLAWVGEKLLEWAGDDGLPDDTVLTTVMLTWLTGSIGTSFRPYSDRGEAPHPLVDVPVAVRVQRRERDYPRSLAERSYRDLRSFSVLERGGHFPALETPTEVAAAVLELARAAPAGEG